MSEVINISLINILHNTGNLKIKHFYKTFKDITNNWIYQNNIKGYCKYLNKSDNLCLTKIDENKIYCEKHSKLLWKNETKIINKLALDIFHENKEISQKPLAISRSINIIKNDIIYEKEEKIPELIYLEPVFNNKREIEPSCPNYEDIYPPRKPDEKYDKIELINKKKKNNKKHAKKPTKLFNIEDFNKVNDITQKMYLNIMLNRKDEKEQYKGINIIKLYNLCLCENNNDMVEFINNYQFIYPVDKDNNVLSLSEYKKRLLNINYNNLGFNNNKNLTYLENIIKFELTCYNKVLLNKSYISNNGKNFIKSIINKIPK